MIINIENKKIKTIFEDREIDLPKSILEKINNNWKKIEQEGSNVWNGKIFCVTDIKLNESCIELYCKTSNYAHYLYGERIGLPDEYCCRNLSAGCLLETSDGYFVIGELDKLTSYPQMLQISGGNVDAKEICNNTLDFLSSISREVKEEVNIDVNDLSQVSDYKVFSIYISDEGEQPGVQIFATAKLCMNSLEMKEYYNKYYRYLLDNNLEVEFGKLYFLKKEECIDILEKMDNPKRNYLVPLIKEKMRSEECVD